MDTWRLALPLLGVLLLCGALAWIAHRLQTVKASQNKHLKLKASLALGPRERIAIVEVAGQQVLLGITPHQINTLLTLTTESGQEAISETSDNAADPKPLSWLEQHKQGQA